MPPSCALLSGFAIDVRVALLWQHNAKHIVTTYKLACTARYDNKVRTRNVSECSVLALCLVRVVGRPFALCYRSVVLSVCLSATLVYCCQTILWINMKLGLEVGLGPGHIVLDGDPAPSPKRDTAPNFRPMSVVAKWLDGLRCHLVRR